MSKPAPTSGPAGSSTVARLKAQLQAKVDADALKGTPANFESRQRSQAEKERKQNEVAKKMAARFNLTYRSLELQSARKAAEMRARDLQAQKDAREAATKYNMTARALKMSGTGTKTGKIRAFPESPAAAAAGAADDIVDDFEEVATKAQQQQQQQQQQQKDDSPIQPPPAEPRESDEASHDKAEEEDTVDDMQSVFRRSVESTGGLSRITEGTREQQHEEHDAFWMPELAKAVESKDSGQINTAVVREFLAVHDPDRLGETEELLKAHVGREDQLMEALVQQYDEVVVVPIESSSPRSSDLMALKVDLSGPVPQVSASAGGSGGFIISGVKKDNAWIVNVNDPEQANVLRARMLAKGLKADIVESVVGDVSEML